MPVRETEAGYTADHSTERRRGRPPIPVAERNSVFMTARFTPGLAAAIAQAAKQEGQSNCEWIRVLIMREVIRREAKRLIMSG